MGSSEVSVKLILEMFKLDREGVSVCVGVNPWVGFAAINVCRFPFHCSPYRLCPCANRGVTRTCHGGKDGLIDS